MCTLLTGPLLSRSRARSCWFVINKLYSERRLTALREEHGLTRNLIIRYTFNVPINLQALQDMLMYKYVVQEDLDSDESSTFKKLVYNEMDTLKVIGEGTGGGAAGP